MANRIAAGSGNFLTAATWQVADTTMLKVNGTTATNVTNSALDSAAYTPGAITVDGILLNMALRVAAPTGTMTVILRNSTDSTNVKTVTINNSDLPAMGTSADAPGCWLFFKFDASTTLVAGKSYKVRLQSSVTSQCRLYAGASNDWNCALRTTTTGAPGANDRLFIQGEYTGAGASTALTVTMDNNDATDYGKIDISHDGTLIYSVAGNTQLRTSGVLNIWTDGNLSIGTVGAVVPAGTTAILEFDCTSSVEFGLRQGVGATVIMQGADKTVAWSLLTANAAAGATSLTINDSVGATWENGDLIALASTTRTVAQTETKALSAAGSTVTLTIAALTNAHSGTSPTQAEVGNLTRNVKIRPTGAYATYFYSNGITDIDWTEIIDVGSATANKRGIDVGTGAALNFNMQYSAIRNTATFASSVAMLPAGLNVAATFVFSNNVVYGVAQGFVNTATENTSWTAQNNLFLKNTSDHIVWLNDVAGTFSANIASSASRGIFLFDSIAITSMTLVTHSNAMQGVSIGIYGVNGTIADIDSWYNNGAGISFDTDGTSLDAPLTFSAGSVFGNTDANIQFNTGIDWGGELTFQNFTIDSDATFSTNYGLKFSAPAFYPRINFENCSFGATTAHAVADIRMNSASQSAYLRAFFDNCVLASTEISQQSGMTTESFIRSNRHDQTDSNWKYFMKYGTIQYDGTTAPVSMKYTPIHATNKLAPLRGDGFIVAVNDGDTVTASVKIYKSAAWNGNQPRLMVRKNVGMGIASDTVLDTATVGTETEETLTGTTAAVGMDGCLELYVDVDGTAGTCSVYTFTVL